MAGIQGLGGIPEPAPKGPVNVRDRKNQSTPVSGAVKDGVQISSAAQQAVTVNKYTQLAKEVPDLRMEKVDAARQKMESGEYKDESILKEIAHNLVRYF